jgi:hypothetical protein
VGGAAVRNKTFMERHDTTHQSKERSYRQGCQVSSKPQTKAKRSACPEAQAGCTEKRRRVLPKIEAESYWKESVYSSID